MEDMKNMPAVPDLFYRTEWKGWDDFLNTQYPYDWEVIEIIKYNYNGLGDAIALCDGRLTYMHLADLNTILFGNQHGGSHYDVVTAGPGSGIILKQSKAAKESVVTAPAPKPRKTKKSSKNVRKKKTKK